MSILLGRLKLVVDCIFAVGMVAGALEVRHTHSAVSDIYTISPSLSRTGADLLYVMLWCMANTEV